MEFSSQECWSGLPFPSPGIEPMSPALQTDSLPSEPPGKPCNKLPDHSNTDMTPVCWVSNLPTAVPTDPCYPDAGQVRQGGFLTRFRMRQLRCQAPHSCSNTTQGPVFMPHFSLHCLPFCSVPFSSQGGDKGPKFL